MKSGIAQPVDILLVDPDPAESELIRGAVRRSCPGCFLQRVVAPEEAERSLSGEGEPAPARRLIPALILLAMADAKNPADAGFLSWLKGHPRTRRLPVVVLSTVDDPSSIRRAYDLGASSYLVRPGGSEEFAAMVAAAATYWTAFNHPPE